MIINLVLIVAVLVADAHAGLLKDVIDFGCLKDSNCGGAEFCDRDFPNPLGRCTAGLEAGSKCLLSRYCASKKCNFFRCSPRLTVRDGPCKDSADCPDDQYCGDSPGKNVQRVCFDRKCTGFCKKDEVCLSGKCHLATCVKSKNC